MLFRPTFCANCGEKIDRAEWHIWTSRRFCQVCETEYKGQDLAPRLIVALGLLIGVFGFGSYIKSGTGGADALAVRQPRKIAEVPAAPANAANAASKPEAAIPPPVASNEHPPAAAHTPAANAAPAEVMYYCGAETKKGTPCSRRVKGNVRCFQHVGMPAMLPAAQLKIK